MRRLSAGSSGSTSGSSAVSTVSVAIVSSLPTVEADALSGVACAADS